MVMFGRAQRTRAAGLRDESAQKKFEARCGRRTSSPVDARVSSIFLVLARRPMVSTVPPTVVAATRPVEHHVARKSAPGTIAGAEKKSRLSDLFPCRRTSQRLALDLWLPPTSNQRPNRGAPAS